MSSGCNFVTAGKWQVDKEAAEDEFTELSTIALLCLFLQSMKTAFHLAQCHC